MAIYHLKMCCEETAYYENIKYILYIFFSLGRDFLRISLKISQGIKEGGKINLVMFSLSD